MFNKVDEADINTFKVIKVTSNVVFSSDKNNVYYNWTKIE
jgi:hypothetical protein